VTEIARKGWCPGALRPMETGDGHLVRLRLANGVLSFDHAAEIADLSECFGNGLIDLSGRANMQLRGVSKAKLEPLWARLDDLDLLDADAASEAVRNVVPSPLGGFDDSAVLDARPIVAALEARLTSEKALHALPPKFGFLVDGGGVLPLTGVDADVRFEAFATTAGPRLAVRIGGVLAGAIAPAKAADVASAIVHAFITLRREEERRMGAFVGRVGIATIARHAGIDADADIPAPAARIERCNVLGIHALGARAFVGAAVAFGRLRARDLQMLAERSKAHGAAELRLTTWRALLVPGLAPHAAPALAAELAVGGFILDGADPRLSLAACPGKPACVNAFADVRAAALSLAPFLEGFDGVLHISGCAKGCALHAPALLTLVATPNGYDLVKNGFARDEPTHRGLNWEALVVYLKQHREGAPL
jgi:precorrin-3B synthase